MADAVDSKSTASNGMRVRLPPPASGRALIWLPGALVSLAGLAACWIIPLRLGFGRGMSYFTPLYISDEFAYLERIAPLPAGATAANPLNGVGDPNAVSMFFLERLCRSFVTWTGLDPLAFFWAWRVLFPLALWACLLLLARACFVRRRPWAWGLQLAAAGAALPVLFGAYHLICDRFTVFSVSDTYVPIFFFLNRVPCNVEYFLGTTVLALYLRFLRGASMAAGVALALSGAAMVYLRPYCVPPFAIMAAAGLLYAGWRRSLSVKKLALAAGVGALAVAPYLAIMRWNDYSQGHRDLLQRLFLVPFPYSIHSHWWLYLILAVVAGWCGLRLRGAARWAVVTGALSLAALPFICGLVKPIARELLSNDRFGCFHLPLLLAAGMLCLSEAANRWRGKGGALAAQRWSLGLAAVGLAAALYVAWISLDFEFSPNGKYYPAFLRRDLRYHAAYRWARENTPPAALFLVDDGFDWTQAPRGEAGLRELSNRFEFYHGDLFHLLARRRRVYGEALHLLPVTEAELYELAQLHWGTFGFPIPKQRYVAALKKYRPDYVLWRKTPPVFQPDGPVPVPRGEYGRLLRNISTVVYHDEFSEIWRINYQEPAASPLPPG